MGTKGEEEERGQTAGQATEHTAADSHNGTHGSRRIRGQAEERGTDGHAPEEWRRQEEHGSRRSRQRTDRQKKSI